MILLDSGLSHLSSWSNLDIKASRSSVSLMAAIHHHRVDSLLLALAGFDLVLHTLQGLFWLPTP